MNCFGSRPFQSTQNGNNPTYTAQNGTTPSFTGTTYQNGATYPAGTTYPTGTTYPNGTTYPAATNTSGEWSEPIPVSPNLPTSPASVAPVEPLPSTLTSPIYTPGYLIRHIGTLMRVEFLIGNSMTDRVGRLREVGASFIILQALDGGSEILCDIYSIKFITLIGNSMDAQLYGAFSNT